MPGGDVPKEARRTRFDITVAAETLAAIDDYRFAARAPNRAEALRRLLKAGLSAQPPDSVSTATDK
jgi:hypothetical protein